MALHNAVISDSQRIASNFVTKALFGSNVQNLEEMRIFFFKSLLDSEENYNNLKQRPEFNAECESVFTCILEDLNKRVITDAQYQARKDLLINVVTALLPAEKLSTPVVNQGNTNEIVEEPIASNLSSKPSAGHKAFTAGFLIAAGAISIAACVTLLVAPQLFLAIGFAVGVSLLATKIAAGVGIAAGFGAMLSGLGVLGLFGKRENNDRVEIVSIAPKSNANASDKTPRLPGNPSPYARMI